MSRKARDYMQDPRVQGKLRDLEKREEAQRREDLRSFMSNPAGRRFMYDLIFVRCELMSVYPGQDSGIYRHAGARDVGYRIAKEVQEALPNAYVSMINEHLAEQENKLKLMDAAITPSSTEPDDA